jgi:hypothetical protein
MVRLVPLVLLVAALCAAGPAQANPLAQSADATVTTTVQQATSAATAAVPAAAPATPTVPSTVRAATGTTRTATDTAGTAAAAAAAPATAVAHSATQAGAYTTASAHLGGSAPPRPSPQALSSSRDRGSARVLRAGRDRAPMTDSNAAPAARARSADEPAAPRVSRGVSGAPRAAAVPDRDGGEGGSAPVAGSGTASAAAASFLFGGAAILACWLCLAGPRLMRRLDLAPAPYRPVALVSSLERPG